MSFNTSLGNELKKARETRKLSLRTVEEVSGLSNSYLSQLENDKIKNPSAFVLYKLAKIYEIELELLLSVSGIIKRESTNDRPNTLAGSALYSKNLKPEEEEALVQYLRFLRSDKNSNKK